MTPEQEIISIVMMGLGAILWPLGGFRWKGFRRIVLPIVSCVCLYLYPLSAWQSLASSLLLFIATTLPYGDRTPWIIPNKHGSKLITALAYILPSLVIGLTWWQMITPVAFLTTFLLSNFRSTEKDFSWKLVEGLIGFCVTATLIASLQRQWGF